MKNKIKEYWILVLFIIGIFSLSPFLTNYFVSQDFGFIGEKSDWIGFSAGLLGSSLTILGIFIQLEYSKKEKEKIDNEEKIKLNNRELKYQIEKIDNFLLNEYIFKNYDVNILHNYLIKEILSNKERFEILKDPIQKTEKLISLEYGDKLKKKKFIATLQEANYFENLCSLKLILGNNPIEKNNLFKKEKLGTFINKLTIMIILLSKLLEKATKSDVAYIKTTLMTYGEPIELLKNFSLIEKNLVDEYEKLRYFPAEGILRINLSDTLLRKTAVEELNNINIKLKIQDIEKVFYTIEEKFPILLVETKKMIYIGKPKKEGDSYPVDSYTWVEQLRG